MKIFCMSCGKGTEYVGEHKKPNNCSCGFEFEKEIFLSASSSRVVSIAQPKSKPRGGNFDTFIIDGESFNIMSLAGSLTPEFVAGYTPPSTPTE